MVSAIMSILILSSSFFLSLISLRLLIPLLQKYFLDIPNIRSSHTLPTPRGGGISFVLMSGVPALLCFFVSRCTVNDIVLLPAILLPIGIVGFIDHRHGLPVFIRFFVQIARCFSFFLVPFLSIIC